MDHIGIDVHKRESQICILGAGGDLIERRVRTTPEGFAAVLGGRPRARILLEASTESEWVARCLEGLGHEVIVADPNFAPMYATRSRRIKTDRRDARALAEACRLGAYRPAHRLSDAQRHVRGRLTVREALVRTRTGYISVIRALLRQHGWRLPTGSAEGFIRRVLALALPGRLRSELAPLLAVMRQVNEQLAYSDARIAAVARGDERVARLQTVPSVGPVTAAAFVATLDDAGRFAHAHQVEAYLGLVPREWSSGEGQRRGRITKAGHQRVRSLLVRPPCPSGACGIPPPPPSGSGPRAAPRGGAGSSPWSHWPGAWPGFSTRCSATAPGITRTGQAHATPGPHGGVVRRLHLMMHAAGFKLDWEDNSNNEANFVIESATGPCIARGIRNVFTQIGTTGPDVKTYTDSNAAAAQAYCYRVGARNAAGIAYCDPKDGTPPLAIPAAPSGLGVTVLP
jgi:transposase